MTISMDRTKPAAMTAIDPRPYVEIADKIRQSKRLTGSDRRIFAQNLGRLALQLDSARPGDAIKKIIQTAGLAGTPLERRSRFFRLPGEEAPEATKNGEYAASGAVFLKLAEAIGQLACKVDREEYYSQSRRDAVMEMISGSSFLRADLAEGAKSTKLLVAEYVARLSEALSSRTRIEQLWEGLETTPLRVNIDDPDDDPQPSPYGEAAHVPFEVWTQHHVGRDWQATFAPETHPYAGSNDWSEPLLKLGYLGMSYEVNLPVIPNADRALFQLPDDPYNEKGLLAVHLDDLHAWLKSTGKTEQSSISAAVGELPTQSFQVMFIFKVGLTAQQNARGAAEVQLSIWRSKHTYGLTSGDIRFLRGRSAMPSLLESYAQGDADSSDQEDLIFSVPKDQGQYDFEAYDDFLEAAVFRSPHIKGDSLPFAIAPRPWENAPEFWSNPKDWMDFQDLQEATVPFDDLRAQSLIFGADNVCFHSNLREAEPIAGVARAHSIAASLLRLQTH